MCFDQLYAVLLRLIINYLEPSSSTNFIYRGQRSGGAVSPGAATRKLQSAKRHVDRNYPWVSMSNEVSVFRK